MLQDLQDEQTGAAAKTEEGEECAALAYSRHACAYLCCLVQALHPSNLAIACKAVKRRRCASRAVSARYLWPCSISRLHAGQLSGLLLLCSSCTDSTAPGPTRPSDVTEAIGLKLFQQRLKAFIARSAPQAVWRGYFFGLGTSHPSNC
jgi:hypothetical protein